MINAHQFRWKNLSNAKFIILNALLFEEVYLKIQVECLKFLWIQIKVIVLEIHLKRVSEVYFEVERLLVEDNGKLIKHSLPHDSMEVVKIYSALFVVSVHLELHFPDKFLPNEVFEPSFLNFVSYFL